jgi:hypothetical protein
LEGKRQDRESDKSEGSTKGGTARASYIVITCKSREQAKVEKKRRKKKEKKKKRNRGKRLAGHA